MGGDVVYLNHKEEVQKETLKETHTMNFKNSMIELELRKKVLSGKTTEKNLKWISLI